MANCSKRHGTLFGLATRSHYGMKSFDCVLYKEAFEVIQIHLTNSINASLKNKEHMKQGKSITTNLLYCKLRIEHTLCSLTILVTLHWAHSG